MQNYEQLLLAWDIGPIHAITPAASGTINQVLLVTAESGSYALRTYRHRERHYVADEHAIITYACARGIPAVAPIALPSGETMLERAGRWYALFPLAPGSQLTRDALGNTEWEAMGAFLAELHQALHDFPFAETRTRVMTVDPGVTLDAIAHYEAVIQALPNRAPSDEYALKRLQGQRAAVERQTAGNLDELDLLPRQAIHGDYTETNLFFENGRVSAIIDWDQFYVISPAWEIVRTFDLVFRFIPRPCHTFLAAYRAIQPLTTRDLEVAARCYGLMRTHDLWMYAAIYDQGNDRVRAFMRPEGFIPIATQWEGVKTTPWGFWR